MFPVARLALIDLTPAREHNGRLGHVFVVRSSYLIGCMKIVSKSKLGASSCDCPGCPDCSLGGNTWSPDAPKLNLDPLREKACLEPFLKIVSLFFFL